MARIQSKVREGELIRLNKFAKSELWGKISLLYMVDTGKLNTNDNQEIEHKAHLQKNNNKSLTTWHNDL